jgi:hypothetical protein
VLGISGGEKIDLDFSASDNELNEIFQEYVEKLTGSIPEIIHEMSSIILSDLKKKTPKMLKEQRSIRKNFEQRLSKDWKKPLDLFELLLVIATEVGDNFNKEFRKDESDRENYVLEVLTRLHARACQIGREILVLLESGYADGAHARWRSLHEIAVVGSFIQEHGNDVAERYLLHVNIESFKAATIYQKYFELLGDTPIPPDEYNSKKEIFETLIKRFGRPYKNKYGWASSVLHKEDPTFSDIEKNIR